MYRLFSRLAIFVSGVSLVAVGVHFLLSNRHLPSNVLTLAEKIGIELPVEQITLDPEEHVVQRSIFSDEEIKTWTQQQFDAPTILFRPSDRLARYDRSDNELSNAKMLQKQSQANFKKSTIVKLQPKPLPAPTELFYKQTQFFASQQLTQSIETQQPLVNQEILENQREDTVREDVDKPQTELSLLQIQERLKEPIDVLTSELSKQIDIASTEKSDPLSSIELSKPEVESVYRDPNATTSIQATSSKVALTNLAKKYKLQQQTSNGFIPNQYSDIEAWRLEPGLSGVITEGVILNRPEDPIVTSTLNNNDTLFVGGWGGHMRLGMRMDTILFVTCDKIVGAVQPNLESLDIAKNVNANLSKAGFGAVLPVAFLPRCQSQHLRAYGVSRNGVTIWPLAGSLTLNLQEITNINAAQYAPADNHLKLESRKPFIKRILKIADQDIPLRTCPFASCSLAATLGSGQVEVIIFEEIAGWTLIQADDIAGWVAQNLVEFLPVDS